MDPFTLASLASAGVSIAQGIGSGARSRNLRRQYDSAESGIPERDPEQLAFLDEIRRNRRAFMAGTDPISAYTQQQARNMGSQTHSNLMRMGRGSTSDMIRAQRTADLSSQAAGAGSAQRGLGLLGMEGTLTNALADRAFNTRWAKANRLWSEYARAKEDSNAQIMAGLGMLPDLAFDRSKSAGANSSSNSTGRMFDPTEPVRMQRRIYESPRSYTPEY